MNEKQFKIVGLGEILWDILPTGKQLGGAPANFAYVSNQLGNHGIVASRVGNDANGREILAGLQNIGIDGSVVQTDARHPTGTVKVSLENGQPNYEITENVAWDFLELTEIWRNLAKNCDALCFGTLARRNSVSNETIWRFIELARENSLIVFDANLRQPHCSDEVLRSSLGATNILKLNHEEFPIICNKLGISGKSEIHQSRNLMLFFGIRLICLTRGANGSLLITKDEISEHPSIKVKIADTIGAGDAFAAGMIHGILRGWKLDEVNEFANTVGAYVASRTGAMPDFGEFGFGNSFKTTNR